MFIVMEKRVEKDRESSRKSLRGTKPRANSDSENLAKKSMSMGRPRGIQNSLDEESKVLFDDVFGRDDEGGELSIETKEIPKNEKQVDASKSQRGTKSRTESNQEIPAKKSTREASTDRTRGKQMRKNVESTELGDGNDGGFLGIPMGAKQRNRTQTEKTKSAAESNTRPPMKKQRESRSRNSLKVDDVDTEKSGDELEESNKEERSETERATKKRILHFRKSAKENDNDDGSLSSDTAFILDAFKKSSERIIEDSDDCMDRPAGVNKTSSRKQSETISNNKMKVKSVNNRRESPLREEHLYHPDDALNFEINTPKVNFSRAADSGFFDKTPSSSSKKRTYDKRDQTPGSAKSDVREETPGGKVLRKSQRFGRLNVQSTSSRTPNRGYQSNDDKHTSRLQEEHESPDEDSIFSHSQPASSNQGRRKRKASRETDIGFKSGLFILGSEVEKRKKSSAKDDDFEDQNNTIEDMNSQDYVNDSFKTPVDSQSMPIQPRKLFQSSDHSAAKKRRKVSRESLGDDNDDDGGGDEDIEDEVDDEVSIGEQMQTSFANLGKEVRKTIKLRQDYVSQMVSATVKLITDKSDEMWSKRSSRRHTIMNEFTNRVNKYVEEHQQIAIRRQKTEVEMITQVQNHMDELAKQREAQEKCLRGILKTKKALTEAFKSMENAEQAQQMGFRNSLGKELKRYRDQAAQEVQKQEFENIKRRIQAMLGMSL